MVLFVLVPSTAVSSAANPLLYVLVSLLVHVVLFVSSTLAWLFRISLCILHLRCVNIITASKFVATDVDNVSLGDEDSARTPHVQDVDEYVW